MCAGAWRAVAVVAGVVLLSGLAWAEDRRALADLDIDMAEASQVMAPAARRLSPSDVSALRQRIERDAQRDPELGALMEAELQQMLAFQQYDLTAPHDRLEDFFDAQGRDPGLLSEYDLDSGLEDNLLHDEAAELDSELEFESRLRLSEQSGL